MSKKDHQADWSYASDDANADETKHLAQPAQKQHKPIEWTASEYMMHEKSTSWYLGLFAGGGLLTIIVFWFTQDILAAIVMLLCIIVIAVYAGREPATKKYVLDTSGVKIDGTFYAFSMFRSFFIIEDGAVDTVWLQQLKRFAPVISIHFAPEDGEAIANLLAEYLPYEEHEPHLIDRLSKRVRF